MQLKHSSVLDKSCRLKTGDSIDCGEKRSDKTLSRIQENVLPTCSVNERVVVDVVVDVVEVVVGVVVTDAKSDNVCVDVPQQNSSRLHG